MLTEPADPKRVALFFFAHQDDEFGIFQRILDELASERRVICIYFTNGGHAGVSASVRNSESIDVLSRLGVKNPDIIFAGADVGIADGSLPQHAGAAYDWLITWLAARDLPDILYVPAWEGGHQDHDALHALVVQAASRRGILDRTWQYPLYNAERCPAPLFRLLHPLRANGAVTSLIIPWRNRIQFLRHCLRYRSQRRSWLGLFPFLLLHYIFNGSQSLQPVCLYRLALRPHDGRLYYEARDFSTWFEVESHLRKLTDGSHYG